jgi:hypothetical protein
MPTSPTSAAWVYDSRIFLTSIHAEANNCTGSSDCPPPGYLATDAILQNYAWLAANLNNVSGMALAVPAVPQPPNFDSTPPHTGYPMPHCNRSSSLPSSSWSSPSELVPSAVASASVLFCDDFDTDKGEVASGLWQWQRNQSDGVISRPWNTTYLETWSPGGTPVSHDVVARRQRYATLLFLHEPGVVVASSSHAIWRVTAHLPPVPPRAASKTVFLVDVSLLQESQPPLMRLSRSFSVFRRLLVPGQLWVA